MIISNNINTSVEVLLGGAITTNQLQCVATWADFPSADFASGQNATFTNSATPVELVPECSTNKRREVKYLSIFNSDTASAIVTVRLNISGVYTTLQKITLPVGYTIIYNSDSGWSVYNTSGAIVTSSTTSIPDGTYGDIQVSSSGTVWTLIASINKAITGIWSFVTGNLRIFNAGSTFYVALANAVTGNRTATFPDKNITVAGIDDVYSQMGPLVFSGNPSDSTTYFAGLGALTFLTTDSAVDFQAPYDLTVIALLVEVSNNSTSGTNENVTGHVRNVTDATSSASFGNFQTNASTTNTLSFLLSGTTMDADAGDGICFEARTPAWATNPIATQIRVWFIVKRR